MTPDRTVRRLKVHNRTTEISAQPLGPPRRPKILIVEDEPGMVEILRLNLQASNYGVVVAGDGLKALQIFESEEPDLVTLDLDVPKVSGYRLIRLFKQAGQSQPVPVIVITASDYEEAEEVVDAGADDFITKPFDPAELIDKIDFVLSRKRDVTRR